MKKLIACLALGAAVAGAHAGVIVDTGTPADITRGYALGSIQSLGASFEVGAASTISEVQGFMVSYSGDLTLSLYADAPSVVTPALFSKTVHVGFDTGWVVADGLDWTVGPGTYTLTFSGSVNGYMPDLAPNPTGNEWFINSFFSDWVQRANLDIGVRVLTSDSVSAVPEADTSVLMLAGLGVVGYAIRRRTIQPTRA